ncbi:MAG: FmdB family zinc ribbon protein [Aggregatilineales bacterium]
MPVYDFRCKKCRHEFDLSYETVSDYDAATPHCPNCEATTLSRLIKKVAVSAPSRDFSGMSSNEMLSVLDSGDGRQVGEMFKQIGGAVPADAADYHDATQRLLNGESMTSVEKKLQEKDTAKKKKAE